MPRALSGRSLLFIYTLQFLCGKFQQPVNKNQHFSCLDGRYTVNSLLFWGLWSSIEPRHISGPSPYSSVIILYIHKQYYTENMHSRFLYLNIYTIYGMDKQTQLQYHDGSVTKFVLKVVSRPLPADVRVYVQGRRALTKLKCNLGPALAKLSKQSLKS